MSDDMRGDYGRGNYGGGRGGYQDEGEGDGELGRRKRGGRRKAPDFTTEPGFEFNYKDPQQLKYFLSDRGKIVPRRVSGLDAKQQRALTTAVRRARNIALLPYTSSQ